MIVRARGRHERPRKVSAAHAVALFGIALATVSIAQWQRPLVSASARIGSPATGNPHVMPSSSDLSPDGAASRPGEIRIPAIGVSAPVVTLHMNSDGTLQVPSRFDEAGWYDGSVPPGDKGSSVIVGHVDSFTGPAIFYRLDELTPGSEIEVRLSGGRWTMFVVTQVAEYPKSAFPTAAVYGDTSTPSLRLITCGGPFDASTGHYVSNVVVFAVALETTRGVRRVPD